MNIKNKNNCKNNIDKETDIYYYILNRKDIAKYTYEDYLESLERKKREKYYTVRDELEKYNVESTKVNNEHDKTYRKILSNKRDVVHIINKALKVEINEEEIEKYNSSFITNRFENRQADMVYKMKNKNIFFLIEHQSKVDYSMPYRLEEYKHEIMKSAIDIKRIKTKGYVIPQVIPIVIYTGINKWRVGRYINVIEDERFRSINLLKYNLIDINKYKKEDLLKSQYLIDKVFLLERTEAGEEFVKVLKEVIERIKDEEDRKTLITIIQTTLREKLGKENVEKIIKEIKGREVTMLGSLSRIIDNERIIGMKQGMQQGVKQGIMKIISNMLEKGMKIEEIKEITGLTNKEIEEAREEIAK